MLTLLTFLILLLAGSAAVVVVTYLRPRYARMTALVVLVIPALLWLLLPARLPLSYSAQQVMAPSAPSAWFWHVDRPIWLLSLSLFLLQIGALLHPAASSTTEQRSAVSRLLVLLGTAAHLSLWAASLPTIVASWSLLGLLWALGDWQRRGRSDRLQTLLTRSAPGLAAIFLLWLGATGLPGTENTTGLDVAGWPTLTRSLALLGAAAQIALAPFTIRRSGGLRDATALSSLLYTTPGLAGAALLLRLEGASDIGLAFALPLTVLGLLALLLAGRMAWESGGRPLDLVSAFVVAQSGLLLLVGVWATPAAVVAETRVLLLGGGVLALFASGQAARGPRESLLISMAPLLAMAAIVGLPLTAGFQGRAGLYGAWTDQGRWLLLLVTVLLHVPLVAAGRRYLFPQLSLSRPTPGFDRRQLLTIIPLLLPALGLLGVAALPEVNIVAWVAVLLPLPIVWLLGRFIEEPLDVEQALRQAFQLPLPAGPGTYARRVVRGSLHAVREAATLLEGEGGILWLLLFLVILWLAR